MELTERQIAIAEGRDPDSVAPTAESVTDDSSARQQEPEASGVSVDDPNPIASADEGDESAKDGQRSATGSTDAADNSQNATTGKESWINDQVRQQAQAYGMSDEDLADFGSEKAYRRALAFADRQFASFVKQQATGTANTAGDTTAKENGKQVAAGSDGQQPHTQADGSLDVQKYIDAGYDEETINLVKFTKGLQDQVGKFNSFLQQYEAQQQAIARQQYFNQFHDAADAVNPDFFGRSVNEKGDVVQLSKEHLDRRAKLHEATEMVENVMRAQAEKAGVQYQPLPLQVLLQRASQVAFGEELAKAAQERLRQQVQQQSSRRRPVAGSTRNSATGRFVGQNKKPAGGMQDTRDYVAEIMSDPDVAKFMREMQTV